MAQHPEYENVSDLSPENWLRQQGLTPREAQTALLVGRGFREREIAEQLQVTPGTAKSYVAQAREKLGCSSMRDLMLLLLHLGLVQSEDMGRPAQGLSLTE